MYGFCILRFIVDNLFQFNYGFVFLVNGDWIYVLIVENVYCWCYLIFDDFSDCCIIVVNMINGGYSICIFFFLFFNLDFFFVFCGLDGNDDEGVCDIDFGCLQLCFFNILSIGDDFDVIDYINGDVVVWGLRNFVGVMEYF